MVYASLVTNSFDHVARMKKNFFHSIKQFITESMKTTTRDKKVVITFQPSIEYDDQRKKTYLQRTVYLGIVITINESKKGGGCEAGI